MIVTNTWFITVGVCTKFCLIVMQDFFLLKISFFQTQFAYSGPIIESGYACSFLKKGKIFENLVKNVQNLKIFLKSAGDCM